MKYDKMNEGNMHMPMVESYQPSEREYAGMQPGKTVEYIERRDRIQSSEAGKVREMNYKGRYE